jgi:hypothetical protein
MSWTDRLKEAAYTSPSGVRTVFKYENVRVSVNKRDSVREFPEFDGAFVQNFGLGATSYPLLCVFWGDDHDLEADDFLNRLAEAGAGILEHPLYGRLENIVPLGPVSRRDDLKTAANQSVFEVNFVQSAAFQFPGSIVSAGDAIDESLNEFNEAQIAAYDADIKITTAREKISLIDNVKAKVGATVRQMKKIAATVQEVENEFNDAVDFIESNINTLAGTPLALARQIINLVQLPARAASQISATLAAYGNLLTATISDANGLFSPSAGNSVNNQFFNSELFARAAYSGMLTAAKLTADSTSEISGESLEEFLAVSPEEQPPFSTQSDIIGTIEFLEGESRRLTAWNEANRAGLDLLDTGESAAFLTESSLGAAGFLVEISFSARQERIVTLGSRRNLIELCAELYGLLDNAFDFLISSNDFSGDEIYELPRGRRIKYYI